MLREIYQEIVGTRNARFLKSSEFDSLDDFRKAYKNCECPVLVQINQDQITEVMSWLSDEDDVCFDTDRASLIGRRMQKLCCEEASALDPLTNTLNRASLVKVIKAAAEQRGGESLSVLLCDMDNLRSLNDAEGHDAGDDAIRSLADVLRDSVTESEILARVGGNRFAILSELAGAELEQYGEQTRRNVESYFADDRELTISIGAATGTTSDCIQSTMSQADEAMYIVKAAGRNRYLHFEEFKLLSEKADCHPDINTDEERVAYLAERVAEYVAMRKHLKLANEMTQAEHADRKHRRRFQDQIGSESFETSGYLTLAFVEVDHFHQVSHLHGRQESERVFHNVCDIVRTQVRETDWLGRYGGKEFCIVMPKTTLDAAYNLLERLREHIEKAEIVSSKTGDIEDITLSIGAIESIGNETHCELLERAAAMALKATRSGRNRVCV